MYTMLVEPADVSQETILRKLEGVERPSPFLIQRNLQAQAYQNYQGLARHLSGSRPDWLEAQEQLVEWAMDKSFAIQSCIGDFLEDPDEKLETTLHQLEELGVHLHRPTVRVVHKKQRTSYTEIMRRRLPATKEELIEELSQFPIKRPAASVRQFLRSHRDQLVEVEGEYRWKI